MCTIYDPNNPKCWNGKIDEWEDCDSCSEDLWEKCVSWWDEEEIIDCWNGKIE